MATDFYTIKARYEKSKSYMARKDIVANTEKNWQMYTGKQWEAVEDSAGMEGFPILNFIKPTVKYKVSTIAQHSVTALFSDLNQENYDTISRLNDLFSISWEKSKMNRVAWRVLEHSAVQGDSYAYWGEGGDTRKPPQIIHNTQMHLGDENITDIQAQPWIIIEERLLMSVVRRRAEANGLSRDEIDEIKGDSENDKSIYNKEEVDPKVTSILYMEKDPKTGIVSVARCTENIMYEKLKPLSQFRNGESTGVGLTLYPVVPMIWEEVPNNARGTSEVEQLVPNQLELNKNLARRSLSVKMTAFPRIAVDESMVSNPEDLNKVGAIIKVNGAGSQSIGNMVTYLAPQAMSGDAKQLHDDLLETTRGLAGASDSQLGNFELSRVSGTAAQIVRDQQQVPLNEQVSMYQDFVENVALLWFELWKTYYPMGVSMDGITVGADEIATIVPNVRVDIAEDTTLSRMASQQELTNLFNNNKITFEEYANAYPEHSSIPKDVLFSIMQGRQLMASMGQYPMDENGNPIVDGLGGGGVNTGGASGTSYQGLQSQLRAK